MKPQELLDRADPPHLGRDRRSCDPAVGGGDVVHEQLRHLLTRAHEPHITFRILPFEAGAHAAAAGSFVVLGGATPELDVVYVDILGGGLFIEKSDELARHKLAFEYLRAQALDIEASVGLLNRGCEEL
ncbi:Scr1 family TA system antitoxin-like transcriptional regulator [Streptomyces sp. NPDC050804]|uniref:Scr1 family TA system antitoxin-like transcriptional regulator n=1 Tax=Streptomyces sp. NPDC050804 TaxID=3154745 RepID=UPI00342C0C18